MEMFDEANGGLGDSVRKVFFLITGQRMSVAFMGLCYFRFKKKRFCSVEELNAFK